MADWTKQILTTELVFIRHAESYNNVLYDQIRQVHGDDVSEEFLDAEETRLRQPDCTLSERGFSQVKLLQDFCEDGSFYNALETKDLSNYIVLSSPMRRCLLTSQAIKNGCNKNIHVHPDLFELYGCYGINDQGKLYAFPGSKSSEIETEFSGYTCLPGMENGWYKSDKVESLKFFYDRVDKVADWIWKIHKTPMNERSLYGQPFQHMIFILHGNLLSTLISRLQKSNSGMIIHNNTGFTRIQLLTVKSNQYYTALKYSNKVDHITRHQLMTSLLVQNQKREGMIEGVEEREGGTRDRMREYLTGHDVIRDHWIQEHIKEDLHDITTI